MNYLVSFIISVTCLLAGILIGRYDALSDWKEQKAVQEALINDLANTIADKEKEHRERSSALQNQIQQARKTHEKNIAAINRDAANRLHDSDKRAEVYKRKAESGTIESRNLADHAARLDRTIVEGRQLVEELSETVRQRGREIKYLSEQLIIERELNE